MIFCSNAVTTSPAMECYAFASSIENEHPEDAVGGPFQYCLLVHVVLVLDAPASSRMCVERGPCAHKLKFLAVLRDNHMIEVVCSCLVCRVLPRWRQVADTGNIATPSGTFQVTDTKARPATCLVALEEVRQW